ncbi:CdaR family transcriptional regulator [Halobacillus sp. Marseille-P3879]|uniref:PucR family transcriptional regulator n=1 Tax=Halobacillus sp. Marseille-P3879 TaxID=2045014 RepID=UPI000C7B86A5|nr:helix-turn-helix domain-containing protein [Halobacillus sp. Marseille-P3879]
MSYIDQLKQTYTSLFVYDSSKGRPSGEYYLFRINNEEVVGIAAEELNEREYNLLSTFLQPVQNHEIALTQKDLQWKAFIDGKSESLRLLKTPYKIRFVLFTVSDPSLEPDTFREALQAFFPFEMPLIWLNENKGLLIEEFVDVEQEPVSLDSVVEVLMSDFYTKIDFYVSEDIEDLSHAPRHYTWAERCFSLAKKYQLGQVVSFNDVIPYVFVHSLPPEDLYALNRLMLAGVEEDRDLLRTIKVFLESGSNASLAAKLLFMHRNSLQYRVDKFVEKTGVDIKQFEQGLVVYLLLLHSNL